MRSTDRTQLGRLGLRWTWIGVVVAVTVVAVAVFRLDEGVTWVVVGAALAVCLAMAAAMIWLDRRGARDSQRARG